MMSLFSSLLVAGSKNLFIDAGLPHSRPSLRCYSFSAGCCCWRLVAAIRRDELSKYNVVLSTSPGRQATRDFMKRSVSGPAPPFRPTEPKLPQDIHTFQLLLLQRSRIHHPLLEICQDQVHLSCQTPHKCFPRGVNKARPPGSKGHLLEAIKERSPGLNKNMSLPTPRNRRNWDRNCNRHQVFQYHSHHIHRGPRQGQPLTGLRQLRHLIHHLRYPPLLRHQVLLSRPQVQMIGQVILSLDILDLETITPRSSQQKKSPGNSSRIFVTHLLKRTALSRTIPYRSTQPYSDI